MASASIGGSIFRNQTPKNGKPGTYPSAINQGAQDYDSLMKQYQNLVNQGQGNPGINSLISQYGNMARSPIGASTYSPISSQSSQSSPSSYVQAQAPSSYNPTNMSTLGSTYNPTQVNSSGVGSNTFQGYTPGQSQYSQSGDVTRSLANLSGLSDTGGYSEQDKSDLRARGVSPIRSIYSSAQQGLDRQRSLQNGYSPNYTAAASKMTRELSDQVSGGIQNVNAGIAQNVASNKLSAAPQYAAASAQANAARTANDQFNTNAINEAGRFNAQGQNETDQYNSSMMARIAELNANSTNRANEFNANTINQANQWNAGNQNQAGMFNANAQNEMNRFNTSNANQNNQFNASNQNQNNQFNANNMNQTGQFNANAQNDMSRFNAQNQQGAMGNLMTLYQQQQGNQYAGLNAMTNLYGTTPANSALYGNQAMQQAQLEEQRRARMQGGQTAMMNAYSQYGNY